MAKQIEKANRSKSSKDSKAIEKKEQTVTVYGDALRKFFENAGLSNSLESMVKTTLHDVREQQQKMVECALVIGERLGALQANIGADKFGTLATNVLPRMGISRSSAYLYIGKAREVRARVSSPLVRNALIMLTDGRGLTTTDDNGKVTVTPEFEKALKTVNTTGITNAEDAEKVAQQIANFIRHSKQGPDNLTKEQRKERQRKAAAEKLLKGIQNYGKQYGLPAAEILIGQMDAWLTQEQATINVESKQTPQAKKQSA